MEDKRNFCLIACSYHRYYIILHGNIVSMVGLPQYQTKLCPCTSNGHIHQSRPHAK